MDNRMNGKIKNTFPDKGYGFIRGEDKKDYFFHYSELKQGLDIKTLKQDDPVTFDGDGNYHKGARAIDIYPA